MVLIQLEIKQPQVFTAKCSDPQVVNSNVEDEGKLTTEVIQAIMSEEKPNQREKLVFRGDRVRKLIPKSIPLSETDDCVCKALEHYNRACKIIRVS